MQRSSTTDPNEARYEAADEGDRHTGRSPHGVTRHAVRGAGRGRSQRRSGTQHRDDPMATARARRRRRAQTRRGSTLLLVAAGVLSCVLMAMIFEPQNGAIAEYHRFQDQVEQNEVKFNTFKTQHEAMQRRLASLQLEKGREQILVEKGYVRPGERILLFPPEPEDARLTDTPQTGTPQNGMSPAAAPYSNDLSSNFSVSPQPTAAPQAASRHSGGTLSGWWRSLRGLPHGTAPGPATTLSEPESSHLSSPDAASSNVATN